MKNIKEYNLDELKQELISLGEKGYRAEQIFNWLYVKKIKSFDDMTNLSLELRENIHNHRKFTDSPHWQISEECLEQLENAFYFIEPDNLVHKYYHLFGYGSINLLNPIPYEKENRNSYKEEETIKETELCLGCCKMLHMRNRKRQCVREEFVCTGAFLFVRKEEQDNMVLA